MATLRQRVSVLMCSAALSGCGAGEPVQPVTGLREIESPAPPGSAEPNLFSAPDGRVFLSWLQPRSHSPADSAAANEYALRFASLSFGPVAHDNATNRTAALVRTAAGTSTHAEQTSAHWSETRTISSGDQFFVNWADFPSLIQMPDGSLAAHWLVRYGDGAYGYHVHTALSADNGRMWSDDIVPHRDSSSTEHGFVSLFSWLDGQLAMVWLDGRKFSSGPPHGGGATGVANDHGDSEISQGNADDASGGAGRNGPEMTLRFTTIGEDGALGAEVLLDARVCDCCQTGAAQTANGPIVVYRDRSPREVRDIYSTRYEDERWTHPEPVHRDGWVIAACPVNGPAVAASGRRVAVAWFTAAGDDPRVLLAFSEDAGASFGPPVRVDDGSPAGRVDVVMLPGGSALVSWLERTRDSAAEVRVRRIAAPGVAGAAPARGRAMTVTVSRAARASGFPRMVRSGTRIIFAWTLPGESPRVHVAVGRLPAAHRGDSLQ